MSKSVNGRDAVPPLVGGDLNAGQVGSSPYATGGGGTSFAHRVAAAYLANLLTRSRRAELEEQSVDRISFQTGPTHPVDDLLVAYSSGTVVGTLAIACRATPNWVRSHQATVDLVRSLLSELATHDRETHRVAVAVSGRSSQSDQLARVCEIARAHADADAFHASFDVDGRWSAPVRRRYSQFLDMVELAVGSPPSDPSIAQRAWHLLSRLQVLPFRVQGHDDADRVSLATSLDAVASQQSDGVAVRDRLEVEATRYDATGAAVDRNLLRRDLHSVLDSPLTRSTVAWGVLAEHRRVATASVRITIGDNASPNEPLTLGFSDRRSQLTARLEASAASGGALLVVGDSGAGKSALVLSTVADLEETNADEFEALVINFRSLPNTGMELRAALGMSVQDLLGELSAPRRLLVIDAADAALERSSGLLNELVHAARSAGVGAVAVTAAPAADYVQEQLATAYSSEVDTFDVAPLSDEDVREVADHFPLLRNVLRDLPASSLLRRPVVLDLLARTEMQVERSLGEWECLELVWRKIVRAEGRTGAGSSEAREQTLLATAAAALNLPAQSSPELAFDSAAVDQLRRDHLLAPASPYRHRPEFAHDEIRRYATAILLVRADTLTDTLELANAPRWALSAATLALKGQLVAPDAQPAQVFNEALRRFHGFADRNGARWADVPIEAVTQTPQAYDCLKAALTADHPLLMLTDVVRVMQQRHQVAGRLDAVAATPVIRVLLDEEQPWDVSKDSFQLLVSWLQALVLAQLPSGNHLRATLRDRLLAFWELHPSRQVPAVDPSNYLGAHHRRRRRRALDYHVTSEQFVESLALLGPDLDERVEACLRAIAADAPAFLAPAVDEPLSARALALHDPELLADLIEAYYIDDDTEDWHLDHGVRHHHSRWTGFGDPMFAYYFGGFWPLFQTAPFTTSIRVLNKILNHGAATRVQTLARHRMQGEIDDDDRGVIMNLDGVQRTYAGDSHVWSWYRGTSVGPYPGMSALLAMERVAEGWLDQGLPAGRLVDVLLAGCDNLAVPGMLYGLLVRHIDKVGSELDLFLAEPAVWELEFGRVINEYSGLRANTDDLANNDRRQWSPRDVSAWLITHGGEERVAALKAVGETLIRNGERLGLADERTKGWAASLDASRYQITQQGDQYYLQVVPPPEVIAAQREMATYQEEVQTTLRLQNRYWGSAKHDPHYQPPTVAEIADDLKKARELLQSDGQQLPSDRIDVVAQVVRTAVARAAEGEAAAFGDESQFATQVVLDVALSFRTSRSQRHEGQYFDLGADRAVAQSLPAYLTTPLRPLLHEVGATDSDVAAAGLAMASRATSETRLYLARGCDIVWKAPCAGNPCAHETAVGWLLESARDAEMGPWSQKKQRPTRKRIKGDVIARLQRVPGDSIRIEALDPAIRGLGAAARWQHCRSGEAAVALSTLLHIQRHAMIVHEENGWTADDRGSHTLIAARALLDATSAATDATAVLDYLDTIRVDAGLMTNFLHGLAAAGAETQARADTVRELWPPLLAHASGYINDDTGTFQDRHWGDWAAAALLPDPLTWTQGLYNEVFGTAIDWVRADDLTSLIDGWLPAARGSIKCVDALIRILRRMPEPDQVVRGLPWMSELCVQDNRASVKQTWTSDEWLKDVRSVAEEHGLLDQWQMLVDAMVVAGNEGLAPYSR